MSVFLGICGVVFGILIIFAIIISFVEQDLSFLTLGFMGIFITSVFFFGSSEWKARKGTVYEVTEVQTSYIQTFENKEIKIVPYYEYLILIQTENGDYRILLTDDIEIASLNEGDLIEYNNIETNPLKD